MSQGMTLYHKVKVLYVLRSFIVNKFEISWWRTKLVQINMIVLMKSSMLLAGGWVICQKINTFP